MSDTKEKLPTWFWLSVFILLLWNFMGLLNFFQHLTMTEETLNSLPAEQQTLYSEFPLWAMVAFGFAVIGGFLASLSLGFRKKIAKPLFIISLIGIVVQMSHSMMVAMDMEMGGIWVIIMSIMLIGIGAYAIWLSNYGIRAQWLK